MIEWDPDGWPKWLTLKLNGWKGKKAATDKQTIRYFRNLLNPSYCPVTGILTWLLISGLGRRSSDLQARGTRSPSEVARSHTALGR